MAGKQRTTTTYTAGGTSNSPAFRPHRGHTAVTVYVKPTSACDVIIQVLSGDGTTWDSLDTAVAVAANVKQPFTFGPSGQLRARCTNTDATGGSFETECVEGGEA